MNEIQAILTNISIVNDNVREVYEKVVKSAATDINPVINGINNLYQALSVQISELKTSVDKNTEAIADNTKIQEQILAIVKTIPGVSILEVSEIPEVHEQISKQTAKQTKK